MHPSSPSDAARGEQSTLRELCRSLREGFALSSPRELVRMARASAPLGLIDDAAWSRLGTLPVSLPAACAIGAFECHLTPGETRVDFEVCIRAGDGGRDVLAAGLDHVERVTTDQLGWRPILDFLRVWSHPQSPLASEIPTIWLEFDLDGAEDLAPAPFVVMTFDQTAPFAGGVALAPAAATALRAGLRLLHGGDIDDAVTRSLQGALANLPRGARLLHAAIRPIGDTQIVRLVVQSPWRDLDAYLARLGWRDDADGLQRWLTRTCETTIMHSVNLDISTSIGPRIGIEYYFPAQPSTDRRWQIVLDALVSAGACTPDRRAQLERWPSYGMLSRPTDILRLERELLLKVVYQAGRPLGAKAYLPFGARLDLGHGPTSGGVHSGSVLR